MTLNDALTADGWAINDEVRSLRSLQGKVGKTTFTAPKGTVGLVPGMSEGLLVKFPDGPVRVANPAKLVSKMGAADPKEPEKAKKLTVPSGYAYLKVGHWQNLFNMRSASGRPASTNKSHLTVEKEN